ncbi:hypothetical protein [Paenibacillus tepidiphilus]|uniref:hypothetical protein n=1 Tax=Paenibacillus tepidiphilus TaxID=2608683 RepID=UPI00123BCEA9|nr:hypothetical protein [Paenibacillus tepidiphilus]
MNVMLMLAGSIIYPTLIYKLLRVIHTSQAVRLYWILLPLCLVISVSGPFLYEYAQGTTIQLSLEAMIDYSIKTGFFSFLLVPSLVASMLWTIYGYLDISRLSATIMAAVVVLGMAGMLGSGSLISQLMYEPEIDWEQIAADDIASAAMWIYSGAADVDNRYIELNQQEMDQLRSMFNSVPESKITEVPYAERDLAADIVFLMKSNEHLSIRMKYRDGNIFVEITNKRSQKEYSIQSAGLVRFFEERLGE